MLLDVVAMNSVASGPVAEAFGAHETARYSATQSLLTVRLDILPAERSTTGHSVVSLLSLPLDISTLGIVPSVQPGPVIAPEPGTRPHERVAGIRALKELALLSGPDLSHHLAAHPDVVGSLLASPPPPRDVTLWWATLDARTRMTLGDATPQLIGNLEGVPIGVRDEANRSMLSSSIDSLDRLVSSGAGRSVVDNARQQLKMLQSISDALDDVSSDVSGVGSVGSTTSPSSSSTDVDRAARILLSLDVTGQGRAAIVLGDVTTADYVTYLVPGMFFTIENQMGAWSDAAGELYDQQLEWLRYFDRASGSTSDGATVATVAWIGYHTPNLTNVGGIQNANEGRDSLASTIMGLQALRTSDEPYMTVIAHSYGSTAALMALTEYDFEVDALALVGSPGSPATSVDALHVRDDNVFVGEGAWDPIPNSSYFGSDPGAASYGAKPMSVAGGSDSVTGKPLLASNGHNEYFSPGTESMRNFALISIGRGQFVSGGSAVLMAKASGTSK